MRIDEFGSSREIGSGGLSSKENRRFISFGFDFIAALTFGPSIVRTLSLVDNTRMLSLTDNLRGLSLIDRTRGLSLTDNSRILSLIRKARSLKLK